MADYPFHVARPFYNRDGVVAPAVDEDNDIMVFSIMAPAGHARCFKDPYLGSAPYPFAQRLFQTDDGKLSVELLWNGRGKGKNSPVVLHKGKLYVSKVGVLDVRTGKAIRGPSSVPYARHWLAMTDTHLYGLRTFSHALKDKCIVSVYTLEGRRVAENVLAEPEPTDPEERKKMLSIYRGDLPWPFSYSGAMMIHGNRIYIRSNSYLYCIGKRE